MSTLIHEPEVVSPDCREESSEDEIRTRIWTVLSSLYPRGAMVERRSENRYPFPYLVRLTPVGPDGLASQGEPVVVVGKHLSERGLGFYHPKPIAHRRMIASLEVSGGSPVALLIDLTWCRFTRHGWYESGGKFLQAIAREALIRGDR
ncbi:MAG: hypothetical protein GXY83_01040 [Rhodopirellula sp.]|nr:hypothetical protein [Rhodopirellula sp.]